MRSDKQDLIAVAQVKARFRDFDFVQFGVINVV
jgi:hypothetical protein